MRRFVLDTNVCLAYVRGHSSYSEIETKLRLTEPDAVPLISIVTKAELISLAIKLKWGSKKLAELEGLFQKLTIIGIHQDDTSLVQSYAEIDAFSQGKLPSSHKSSAKNMGKNDLWIAATTHVAKATLVTADGDFDHLDKVYFPIEKFS